MDINYIYELLQKSSQSRLIDYIEEHEKEIAINPTAQNAVNLLLQQMCIGEIESEKNIKEWFETLYLIKYDKNVAKHKKKRVYPTYIDFEKIIICLVKIESDSDRRKGYALKYPQNPICKAILVEKENVDIDTNNIVKFNPIFNKTENIVNEELPISVKKRMKKTILEKLASQKISSYRRTTIAMLYEMTIIVSVDYKEALFKECLKELRKKNKVYFGNIGDIYSEISLT